MLYVELLEDVAEGGRSLAKARAAADAFGLGRSSPNYPQLKVTVSRRGRIEYRKGTVVTMNEDGAKKWVERGIGKVVAKPAAPKGEQQVLTKADIGTLKV